MAVTLPKNLAGGVIPVFTLILSPIRTIKTSLRTISPINIHGILPQMSATANRQSIKHLSATGSSSLPISVVSPLLLAIQPSIASVPRAASITKVNHKGGPSSDEPCSQSPQAMGITAIIRSIDSRFGRLSFKKGLLFLDQR